jgi:hypothetical protein
MSSKRLKLPETEQTRVLTSSRRRCCLCWGLDGVEAVVDGQIAHIDRDRNNNRFEQPGVALLSAP